MKSIYSIFAVAVFSSFCLQAVERNYSLWPRRPDNVADALALLENGGDPEKAYELALPSIREGGIGGQEARRIVGRVNAGRYLSGKVAWLSEQTVRGGDSLLRLSDRCKCPVDVLIYLNNMTTVTLRAGQKLKVPARVFKMELLLNSREVLVWDGETLVAAYPILQSRGTQNLSGKTVVEGRLAFLDGAQTERMHVSSYVSADKQLVLANGMGRIASSFDGQKEASVICLSREDCNELALLFRKGNEVIISRGEKTSSLAE